VLTAYVLAIAHEARWAIPSEIQSRLERGLHRFVQGAIIRQSAVSTVDLPLRKLSAVEALSRHGKATRSLLDSFAIEPNLWPTSAVLDWWSILHRMPDLPDRGTRQRESEQIIRARLNLQGTTMGFSRERSDALWWLMVSPDVNALRLILHLLEARLWPEELPRLIQGALARRRHGAWDLTVANAWGTLAVERFARAFEAAPVAGTTTAGLVGTTQRIAWATMPQGGTLSFPWPSGTPDLELRHEGGGRPWITLQAQAALPLRTPLSSGYRVTKTLLPVEQRTPGRWRWRHRVT
jgi:alpha-2-macroglobulin